MKLGFSFFGIACLPLVVGLGCGNSNEVTEAPDGGAPSRDGGADASVAVVDITPVYIVVDQFGYRPVSEKIAVVRSPVTGYDQPHPYTPGAKFALVNANTGEQVLVAAATAHNGGNVDKSSGDKAWWFDFSSITAPGDYYVLDVDTGVKSFPFRIAEDVYRDVLKQAVRTFFYQRAGQKKDAMYAGPAWADEASHVGPGQDHNCRLFSAPNDATTEKDLWGGWYDAGDYNKYTRWTANYVITLLRSYTENPAIWGDDFGIPESGNGITRPHRRGEVGARFLDPHAKRRRVSAFDRRRSERQPPLAIERGEQVRARQHLGHSGDLGCVLFRVAGAAHLGQRRAHDVRRHALGPQ